MSNKTDSAPKPKNLRISCPAQGPRQNSGVSRWGLIPLQTNFVSRASSSRIVVTHGIQGWAESRTRWRYENVMISAQTGVVCSAFVPDSRVCFKPQTRRNNVRSSHNSCRDRRQRPKQCKRYTSCVKVANVTRVLRIINL